MEREFVMVASSQYTISVMRITPLARDSPALPRGPLPLRPEGTTGSECGNGAALPGCNGAAGTAIARLGWQKWRLHLSASSSIEASLLKLGLSERVRKRRQKRRAAGVLATGGSLAICSTSTDDVTLPHDSPWEARAADDCWHRRSRCHAKQTHTAVWRWRRGALRVK